MPKKKAVKKAKAKKRMDAGAKKKTGGVVIVNETPSLFPPAAVHASPSPDSSPLPGARRNARITPDKTEAALRVYKSLREEGLTIDQVQQHPRMLALADFMNGANLGMWAKRWGNGAKGHVYPWFAQWYRTQASRKPGPKSSNTSKEKQIPLLPPGPSPYSNMLPGEFPPDAKEQMLRVFKSLRTRGISVPAITEHPEMLAYRRWPTHNALAAWTRHTAFRGEPKWFAKWWMANYKPQGPRKKNREAEADLLPIAAGARRAGTREAEQSVRELALQVIKTHKEEPNDGARRVAKSLRILLDQQAIAGLQAFEVLAKYLGV